VLGGCWYKRKRSKDKLIRRCGGTGTWEGGEGRGLRHKQKKGEVKRTGPYINTVIFQV